MSLRGTDGCHPLARGDKEDLHTFWEPGLFMAGVGTFLPGRGFLGGTRRSWITVVLPLLPKGTRKGPGLECVRHVPVVFSLGSCLGLQAFEGRWSLDTAGPSDFSDRSRRPLWVGTYIAEEHR